MQTTDTVLIVIVSIVCLYTFGSLYYIQKKIGEMSSCPRGLSK